MSKKNKKLMCAVYLSVDAPDKEIQDKEEKQFRYIKDYCKGNGLKIVKSYHRAGVSRCEMQKHFVELARQIEIGELQADKLHIFILYLCDHIFSCVGLFHIPFPFPFYFLVGIEMCLVFFLATETRYAPQISL